MDFFLKNIIDFVAVLRLAGIRAGVSETMDAIGALACIDLPEKDQVGFALSACLAKSSEEKQIFREAFHRFFIEPEERSAHIQARLEEQAVQRKKMLEEASGLKFQEESLDLEEELKEVYSNLSMEEKKSIQDFLERTSSGKNVRSEFKPVAERMVAAKLKGLRDRPLPGEMPASAYPAGSEAGVIAQEVLESRGGEEDLMNCRVDRIRDEQVPAVIGLLLKLTDQLRKKAAAGYRHSKRASTLDFKKTIQYSHASGGVPFRLKYRKRPKRKSNYLLLCDVSASMYRFSGFVQQFIRGMNIAGSNVDSFIFSDEAEHLDMKFRTSASGFEQQVMQSSVWRRGTNIFNALRFVLESRHVILNSSTIVLMVSDAKTLDAGLAAEQLNLLESRVKRIFWLNPLPEREWTGIKGMDQFRNHAAMMDCSTLSKLASSCAEIV